MSTRKTLWIVFQKQKKYILSVLMSWSILLCLSLFFGSEYINFYHASQEQKDNKIFVQEQLNHFSLDSLEAIDSIEIISTPDINFLDEIVQRIDASKKQVLIEVYLLTEKRIPQALKRAHKRWIDVRIILEKNPYKAFNINNKNLI